MESEDLQQSCSKTSNDTRFPFLGHLHMPRRADCEQEDQKIREDIKRTRDDEERFPVDAVTSEG